jgi:hypothetical protein
VLTVAEPSIDHVRVEPEPGLGSFSESDGAELALVRVHPLAAHAQARGHLGDREQPWLLLWGLLELEQSSRDRVDETGRLPQLIAGHEVIDEIAA